MGDEEDQKLIEEWLKARGWEQDDTGLLINRRYMGRDGNGVRCDFGGAVSFQEDRDLLTFLRAWNEAQWTRIEPGCKMPRNGERILVYTSYGVERTGAWRGEDGWYVDELLPMYARQDIVSWRPMPAAPKEDGDA